MSLCARFLPILLLSLLFVTVGNAESKWRNLGREVLKSEEFEDALKLLGPKSLLDRHKTIHGFIGDNGTAANDTCTRDIAALNGALLSRELWALQMLDASSKIPSGLLEGNIIDLGMYDECIGAEGQFLGIEIKGRHCMYSVKVTSGNISIPVDPTMSICVPRSCSADDIEDILNATLGVISKFKKLGVAISGVTCATLDRQVWDTEFTVWTLVLGGFLAFLLVCSVCKAQVRRSPAGAYADTWLLGLGRFSLQSSAEAILSTEPRRSRLPALDGLRVLSMAWVVLGHEFFNQLLTLPVNPIDILPWVQSWKALYVLDGPYAVDTFFTISGFMMAYVFMKQMPKQKSFNVLLYYLHRFIRLSPAVIGLLIVSIVIVPKIGSGARWDFVMDMHITSCRDKFWPTLFYVQNFQDLQVDSVCLGHLWYLAVDMQLFLISPFILYPLYKKPKVGLTILAFLLVISIVVPASIIASSRYHVISVYQDLNQTEIKWIFQEIYEKTYNRATPWLMGIFLGFEVVHKNRTLSKKTTYAGWLAASAAFAFCLLGTKSFTDPNYVYNPIWEDFFAVATKPIWAFGICWICYASIYNCAGTISSILSWRFFLPLSRLSYCIYLVHFVVQIVRIGAGRTSTYFSDWSVWHVFLGDLVISVVVAFLFSLVFESPAIAFEAIIFKNKRESRNGIRQQLATSGDHSDEEKIINEEE